MNKVLRTIATSLAVSVIGSASFAASVTCNTNGQPGSHVFSVDDAVDAACLYGSQDFAAQVNAINAFTYDDWVLADRDAANANGDGYITFDTDPVPGGISGMLSITTPLPSNILSVMVSLKTSNTSGLFLMDLNDLASNWSIFRAGSTTQGKGLSHSSLYYRAGPPTTVPLPAAGFLLLGALGGLTLMRRKKT